MKTVNINGNTIVYKDVGSGVPLLLLHTLLADNSVYDRVIPELAKNYRVISPNFPGYGGSIGEVKGGIEAYAAIVAAFLDSLGIDQVDLLGNGFGGFVAQAVAIAYPERVKHLMLVDTAAGFPEEGKVPLRAIRAKVLENGITAILDAAMGRMFPASYIAAAPDVIAERRAALSKADAALFANACGALIALDHRPSLHKVHHETLVMVGLEDQTTPPALSRELASLIPQSKLVELPGLGHCPQIQDPAAFVAAVRAFLA